MHTSSAICVPLIAGLCSTFLEPVAGRRAVIPQFKLDQNNANQHDMSDPMLSASGQNKASNSNTTSGEFDVYLEIFQLSSIANNTGYGNWAEWLLNRGVAHSQLAFCDRTTSFETRPVSTKFDKKNALACGACERLKKKKKNMQNHIQYLADRRCTSILYGYDAEGSGVATYENMPDENTSADEFQGKSYLYYLGKSQVSAEVVQERLGRGCQAPTGAWTDFDGENYHFLYKNCNYFTHVALEWLQLPSQEITGYHGIPEPWGAENPLIRRTYINKGVINWLVKKFAPKCCYDWSYECLEDNRLPQRTQVCESLYDWDQFVCDPRGNLHEMHAQIPHDMAAGQLVQVETPLGQTVQFAVPPALPKDRQVKIQYLDVGPAIQNATALLEQGNATSAMKEMPIIEAWSSDDTADAAH